MSAPARFNPDLLWKLDMDELREIAQTVKVGKFRLQVNLDDTKSREEDILYITLSRGGQHLAQVALWMNEAGEIVAHSSAVDRGADTSFSHLAMDLVETLTGKMSEAATTLIAEREAARKQAEMDARRAEDAEIETDLRNSLTYLGM